MNKEKLDLTDYQTIKALLKKFNVWTKKRLGQHFLVNKKVLEKIIKTADIKEGENITEIGSGHGVLTLELLKSGALVDAIEIDETILPILRFTTNKYAKKITIHHKHVLGFTQESFPFKLIANIPYHLTSPIIRKFLIETEKLPEKIVLLVQKEVAERICKEKDSIISLFVKVFGSPKIIEIVDEKCFFPPPKVKSAILLIDTYKKPKINIDKKIFFFMVKNGFSSPRKMLKNVLSNIFQKNNLEIEKIFSKLNIPIKARAEDLSIANWENLAKTFLEKKLEQKN